MLKGGRIQSVFLKIADLLPSARIQPLLRGTAQPEHRKCHPVAPTAHHVNNEIIRKYLRIVTAIS